MSDVAERVKQVTAVVLNVEEDDIKPESRFVEDLGAESIQSIELVAAFEAEFDVEMKEEEALSCRTIGKAIELITAHLEE